MPRDPSGIYSTPVGTDGIPNFPIESAKYNTNAHDVETDLNTPRPIVAGGTGANSTDGALDNLSAEKFKQVISNWDTTVWRAGSFYAAATATGIAPVAGHAFAGIAYYANASDLVLEATDLTDPANPLKYVRMSTAGIWSPWTVSNSAAASIGEYTFDGSITFPPASGQIRFNNATQNSATEIFISHLTATGIDATTQIPLAIKLGFEIAVQDKDEANKYKIFIAAADPVLSGGDYRVTVAFKSGGVDIVSAQRVLVNASPGTGSVRYDTAQSLTSAQQSQARTNIAASPILRGYIAGLTLSTPGSSSEITMAAGVATDNTNVDAMVLSVTIVKNHTAWVVGAGGGVDTGAGVANTWYHAYIIKRPDTGVVDWCLSTSAVAPVVGGSSNIPATYTLFRRVGSAKITPGSVWQKFIQIGDKFVWDPVIIDYSAAGVSGGTIAPITLSVPPGLSVTAQFYSNWSSSSAAAILTFNHGFSAASWGANTPNGNISLIVAVASTNVAGQFSIETNTASQIGAGASLTGNMHVATQGWIDRRGRDA